MRITAGIFLLDKDFNLLVCHPTKHKPNVWGIPKGRLDEGETVLDGALRETFEETNIDLAKWSVIHTLEPVPYKNSDKVLRGFVIFESQNKFDFSKFDLKCNSNVEESRGGFPEMDDYKWMSLDDARSVVHYTQVTCLDYIQVLIDKIKSKK